ncbi:hypothetical protein GIB67_027528 [Kingdonia uniflora]|uniref:C3H1-type domain-containing protein n=1 Tax=Kingdonia uniflora TaxID=39325 RepID=A0A7J7MFL0_9MAGN|nr:hypothetical protein GIB67_027528 [Kingdonia uniflora]
MGVEGGFEEGFVCKYSVLLEFSASDDVIGFKRVVEEEGFEVDEMSFWYGRGFGSRKMRLEERTPLMIAAMFGSKEVLKYIVDSGKVDVNRACGSDGATALHCAAAGGSMASIEIVKLLIDASADVNSVDANGNRPRDVIPPLVKWSREKRRSLEAVLNGFNGVDSSDESLKEVEELQQIQVSQGDGVERKEYPVDLSLPDINNGVYGTDEFRMYTFKVKPCSRAYSHDWTECPFVHPGENARRRDPRKYHYSCVPCPEFRKGTCRQADNCEYAHGVFECWLHPAQYRTRLCKDETGCSRRVCFFAHNPEDLRPLYASTGSGMPSPRSSPVKVSSLDMSGINPLGLGSPSYLKLSTSTPPMSPSSAATSPMWQNQSSFAPPTLQLPGSRLKSSMSARDMDFDMDMLSLEHQRQQLMDEISNNSSRSTWSSSLATARTGDYSRFGGVTPTNLEDVFGSIDSSVLSHLQGLALKSSLSQVQSPTGMQIRQNMNQQQLRSSYPTSMSSSPVRTPSSFGLDAVMNSRSTAFAKRSQSFVDRGALNRHVGVTSSATALSDWGSPTGKLDWGVQGEELNKLRKSASFGIRDNSNSNMGSLGFVGNETNLPWTQSLVKDVPPVGGGGQFGWEEQKQYHLNSGGLEMLSPWMEQMYMEQEQMVA